MNWQFPYECTIITRTAGTVIDDAGDAIPVLGTIETVCDLQQIRRDEPKRAGETSVTTWNAYFPVSTEFDTADLVEVQGVRYEATGDPWRADTGSESVNHLEATVVKAG